MSKRYALSEKRIETAWVKYNTKRYEILEKARAKGDYSTWQYEWIDTFEEFRLEYKHQRTSNQAMSRIKGREYYKKANITQQLIKKAKVWKTPTIRKYAKTSGYTMKESVERLSVMSRQDLFNAYLQVFGGDYDAAAAMYEAVVNGVGEATYEYAEAEGKRRSKEREKRATRYAFL